MNHEHVLTWIDRFETRTAAANALGVESYHLHNYARCPQKLHTDIVQSFIDKAWFPVKI